MRYALKRKIVSAFFVLIFIGSIMAAVWLLFKP